MRNVLLGLGSSILLGGVLGVGILPGQETAGRPAETAADTAAPSPPVLGSTYVITPEVIDCTNFVSPHRCRFTIFVRPAAFAPDRELRLKAVVTTADGDAVNVALVAECSTGCSNDVVRLGAEPANSVRATLMLPLDWRRFSLPQVGSGFIGIVSDRDQNRFEGTPKRFRVLAPSPSYWQWIVILVPGLVALLTAAPVVFRLKAAKIGLDYRMGAPSWKASESWSSNLTVGAGLVNGVMALAVVSDFTVFMTKSAYGMLSMLLGAFVLLAPIVYGISRRAVEVVATGSNPVVTPKNILVPTASAKDDFEGAVWVFLVAGVLTLWASGGQLITFALLVVELWRFGVLSGPLATLVALLVLSIFVALLMHGATSMYEAAVRAKPPLAATAAGREGRVRAERAPGWALL